MCYLMNVLYNLENAFATAAAVLMYAPILKILLTNLKRDRRDVIGIIRDFNNSASKGIFIKFVQPGPGYSRMPKVSVDSTTPNGIY